MLKSERDARVPGKARVSLMMESLCRSCNTTRKPDDVEEGIGISASFATLPESLTTMRKPSASRART